MSSWSKKRKNRPYEGQEHEHHHQVQPDTSLFIQAHEADLVRGPQAAAAARSLEIREVGDEVHAGDGLIRWGAQVELPVERVSSDDSMALSQLSEEKPPRNHCEGRGVWVDRYDARLLLESLPDLSSSRDHARPNSPGGWSDLPSDAEDTFFFSVEEAEDYRRGKRRRVMDRDREARLRALHAEEGSDEEKDPKESWGGSDEEPDEAQREFMRRTASHILLSPNPAQLEMRILANHGADPRFAFLRGRWSRAWRLSKGKARLEQETERERKAEEEKKQGSLGIGGLSGYGDSDEESEDREAGGETPGVDGAVAEVPIRKTPPPEPEDEVKAARRARAREWAEKRRAAKVKDTFDGDS